MAAEPDDAPALEQEYLLLDHADLAKRGALWTVALTLSNRERDAALADVQAKAVLLAQREKTIAAVNGERDVARRELAEVKATWTPPKPAPEPPVDPPPAAGGVTFESLKRGTFAPGKIMLGCSAPQNGFTGFKTVTGVTPPIWHDYATSGAGFAADLKACPAGCIPLINFKPQGGAMGLAKYNEINAGTHDAQIRTAAAACKAHKGIVLVSPLHEFENDALPAKVGQAKMIEADKAHNKAFRRIVEMFRAAGVTNGIYVWNVMGFDAHVPRYDLAFPGVDVVDIIAFDPYLEGDAPLSGLTKRAYDWADTKFGKDRTNLPIMWAEVGFNGLGKKGDGSPVISPSVMAKRVTPAELDKLQAAQPHLKYIVYWSEANYVVSGFADVARTFFSSPDFVTPPLA